MAETTQGGSGPTPGGGGGMRRGRKVIRDFVVKLSVARDRAAQRTMKAFQKGLAVTGKLAKLAVVDLVGYAAAVKIVEARLGSRALQWNIRRTQRLIGGLTTTGNVATEMFHRFAGGLGLVNAALVENARATLRRAELLKMNVESFQSVAFAFEEFDLTEHDVTTALMRFGRQAEVALDKVKGPLSQAREEFQKIGISVKELEGRDPLQVMELVAHKMSRAPTSQQKKAIRAVYRLMGEEMGAIFGESLSNRLVPILQKGAEGITELRQTAYDRGLIIPEADLERGRELARSFNVLQKQLEVFWSTIGLKLAPAVQVLVELWSELIERNRQWILARAEVVANALADAIKRFADFVKDIDFELLLAIWGAYGLIVQAGASTTSLAANVFLLVSAYQALLFVLRGIRFLYLQLPLMTRVYIQRLYQQTIATWAAWAATLALEVTLGTVLAVIAGVAAVILLAIPPLILFVLAIEDLITYLKGGRSVFGLFVEWIDRVLPFFREIPGLVQAAGRVIWSTLKLIGVVLWEITEGVFKALGYEFETFTELIEQLVGPEAAKLAEAIRGWTGDLNQLADAIDLVAGSLGNLDQSVSDSVGWVIDGFKQGVSNLGQPGAIPMTGAAPGISPFVNQIQQARRLRDGAVTNDNRRTSTVTQNISVSGGADERTARMVGDEAARGAREVLENTAR